MPKSMFTDKQKVLKTMAALCSKKEQCSADILAKLEARGLNEKECAECMAWLVDNHFIDDRRFALFYTRDKFRFNHWGPTKIHIMLRSKGIFDEYISEALKQIDSNDLLKNCIDLLCKKRNSLKNGTPQEIKIKLIKFGLGRGFNYEIINKALRIVL